MAKKEISWKRKDEDGNRCQVKAHQSRSHWDFFVREGRFDEWMPLPHPPLEDWLALLDGLERRVVRRMYGEADIKQVKTFIHQNFPEAVL